MSYQTIEVQGLTEKNKELIKKVYANLDNIDIANLENMDYIKYTILHIKTIEQIYKDLGKQNVNELHDLDKVAFYTMLSKQDAHNLHREIQKHHNHHNEEMEVIVDEVMDWESAHFTKPDKPLSAYETLEKYYNDSKVYDKIKQVMIDFDLWNKGNYVCITEEEFYKKIDEISLEEVANYVKRGKQYLHDIIEEFGL